MPIPSPRPCLMAGSCQVGASPAHSPCCWCWPSVARFRRASRQNQPSPSAAPPAEQALTGGSRIAAVVNGDVISEADIANRARLFAISTGLPLSPEVIDRLKPQILRQLIDERLRVQEAQRRKIVIQDAQIAAAIKDIEARNNMQPGALAGEARLRRRQHAHPDRPDPRPACLVADAARRGRRKGHHLPTPMWRNSRSSPPSRLARRNTASARSSSRSTIPPTAPTPSTSPKP